MEMNHKKLTDEEIKKLMNEQDDSYDMEFEGSKDTKNSNIVTSFDFNNSGYILENDVIQFLKQLAYKAEVYFDLIEAKETSELIKIAKKRGIQLPSVDLAIFKGIYAKIWEANKNGIRIEKDIVKQSLQSLVGKPLNIDHLRKHYVCGHIIDADLEDDKVIIYGVFYKNVFQDEFDEILKAFKENRLTLSFEIHCPDDQRNRLKDGTTILKYIHFAGGALLWRKEKPACPEAHVLELAKQIKEQGINTELIYAERYEGSEDQVTVHQTPPINKPAIIVCRHCQKEIELVKTPEVRQGVVKCPHCGALLNGQTGEMIQLPTKQLSVVCPTCRTSNWIIEKEFENCARVKCPTCQVIYDVEFKGKNPVIQQIYGEPKSKMAEKIWMVNAITSLRCPQCNATDRQKVIDTDLKTLSLSIHCDKCKIDYDTILKEHKIVKKMKKIEKIEKSNIEKTSYNNGHFHALKVNDNEEIEVSNELGHIHDIKDYIVGNVNNHTHIIPKKDNIENSTKDRVKGGDEMFKVELTKFHRIMEFTNIEDVEKAYEIDDVIEAKKITTEEKKNLPDSDFAVVIRVKNKTTGETRKIRKFPMHDEAHVRNALSRLGQEEVKKNLQDLGVSVESVIKKVLARAKKLGMTELMEKHQEEVKNAVELEEVLGAMPDSVAMCIRGKVKEGIKLSDAIKTCWESYTEAKEKEHKQEVEFIKSNVKEIIKRREELGKFAEDLSDEDIINKDKYELAKAKKENEELKTAKEDTKVDDDLQTAHTDKQIGSLRTLVDNKANEIRKNS